MFKRFNLASGAGFSKKPNYHSYQRYYASRESMEKTILDYVFTKPEPKGGFTGVWRYLEIPDLPKKSKVGNPNKNYPSDHWALGFEFLLTKTV